MRIKSILLCSLLTLLALFPAAVCAQDAKERAEKEAERRRELRRQTYVLVDEIATGALSLKLPDNRAFMLVAAADLLWEKDEKRARNLFWDAINTLQLMVNPTSSSEPNTKKSTKTQNEYFANLGLRRELLRRVSQRDPQLAIEMFRATQQQSPELSNTNNYFPERELEQQLAAEAAARDPKRALEIARESLAKGITFQIYDLLFKLNDRDAELGTKFAIEIVDKLQTKNLATELSGSRIAVDLLVMSRTPEASPKGTAEWRTLKLEPEKRRELVNMIANAALGLSANSSLLYSISEIRPEIEEFAPERLALLEKKHAAFKQTLSKEQRGWDEYNMLVRQGSPEMMLVAARSAASDEIRRSLQQQAITIGVFRRRADSLREVINSGNTDESQRRELIDALDSEQINQAVNLGNADELRRLLPQVRLKEARAQAMAEIAVLLEKKGDHEEAVKLLDEARTMVKIDLDSESQSNALLALVAAYAVVDPDKAFAIIEKTVDRANSQLSKLLLLDKFISTGIAKKGELTLHHSGMFPLDLAMFKYSKAVASLAEVNFDRTKALADRFDRNELRLIARLLLAQALIRSRHEAETKRHHAANANLSQAPAKADASIDVFWEKFRAAVIKEDKATVAGLSHFPISMPYGMGLVKTRAQLIRRYRDVFYHEGSAAKCFADSRPVTDPARPREFSVGCKNSAGDEVVIYSFERTRNGWHFRGLDNINE